MSADPVRLQLGELLVHKGLITEAQLDQALAEQRQSGAPLGEILVRLGFAKGPTIANALADQHGGPLRTEYGLSIGPTHVVAKPAAESREQDTAIIRLQNELERTQAELAQAQAELAAHRPSSDRHMLFVPGPEGYTLVERTGPVPGVGAAVAVGAAGFTVLRVGPSTLLGVPIDCALLAYA